MPSNGTEALLNLVRRHGVGRGLCWSSGGKACCAGTEARMTEQAAPLERKGMFGVSKLGSQCQSYTAPHRWLSVCSEGQWREMAPAGSFAPREVSP